MFDQNTTQLRQINVSLEQARDIQKDGEALDRLYKNRDFIRLIEKKYLQDEPVRLTYNLTRPGSNREEILKQLDAIAGFRDFLMDVNRNGTEIAETIRQHEHEQSLILSAEME